MPRSYSIPFFTTQVRLLIVIGISSCFLLGELGIGFKTHSLALVADAFHYTGDLLSFVVAYLAEKYSAPPPADLHHEDDPHIITSEAVENRAAFIRRDDLQQYRHILPILAAFFNSVFLLALGLAIFLQGIEKFVHLEEISDPRLVMIMGCVGVVTNVMCASILGTSHAHSHGHSHGHDHGHDHQTTGGQQIEMAETDGSTHHHSHREELSEGTALSVKAVLLHIAADALNNVAVIISAAIMWKVPSKHAEPDTPTDHEHVRLDGKYYADPACTVFIAVLIVLSTCPLVLRSGRALVRAAAGGARYDELETGCSGGEDWKDESTTHPGHHH
ncbi:hypothetical protein FQN57_002910 [Myotisia sp. PD_48]|nr:hypothetical protein FQN57_002910 [Myotisia sp. PD_48]